MAALSVSVDVDEDYGVSGMIIKLFTRRGDYPRYFDDDLEKYVEGIAILYMTEYRIELSFQSFRGRCIARGSEEGGHEHFARPMSASVRIWVRIERF